ncbi:hypothetical protein FTUN_3872 [Frigoriglobus tundricola]|uniref:Uncharacterized protein n=1 Tax=Frigoriglobus tundricola TaxID=2774151 RepID=A0A6M5YQM2_9BACT|nr:hypothetical protein FTUN_3872 [Frigoriglobus tundricola]
MLRTTPIVIRRTRDQNTTSRSARPVFVFSPRRRRYNTTDRYKRYRIARRVPIHGVSAGQLALRAVPPK